MNDEIQVSGTEALKCEYNTKTLHRIHRIQGQLAALEKVIEQDAESCEDRVIRARTIEKGMSSLISHLVECYLVNTARDQMESDPGKTTQEITRNTHDVAQGTRDVSVNIGGIKQAVGETGVAASNVLQLAKALGHTADALRGEVEGFLVEIRAA